VIEEFKSGLHGTSHQRRERIPAGAGCEKGFSHQHTSRTGTTTALL
jgi:hypothetical protein